MVSVWGIRLSGYLFYRILKIGKDDRFDHIYAQYELTGLARFDNVRGSCIRFSIWFLFQFIGIWLVSSPQIILNGEPLDKGINALDIVGWVIWGIGFLCEAISDHQKFTYRI